MTLIINHSQIKQCIELCSDLIPIIENAFIQLSKGNTAMPPILRLDIKEYHGIYDEISCAEICGQFLKGITTDHTLELNQKEKERIFNLGYYTWVEQQGIDLNDFEKRRDQQFWRDHCNHMLSLDDRIEEFNAL